MIRLSPLATRIKNPCMPRASARLFAASQIKWM